MCFWSTLPLSGQTPATDTAQGSAISLPAEASAKAGGFQFQISTPVIIQATRTGANSPVPHTNLSAAKIAQTNQAADVPYLLSAVPSLVESSDAGAGVGYTGLRIRGSDPTRINVTINGVPFNDAESQGVFWVDLPDVAASASEIQVQRGVGTSTNGAGAFGATVNLDLSRVEAEPFGTLSATAGSFGTQKYSVYAGTGLLSGHFALAGRLSKVQSDGYIDRAKASLEAVHLTGAYVGARQAVQLHFLSGHEVTYQAWNGVPAQYLDSLPTFNTAGVERPDNPYPNQVDDYTQRHFLLHYRQLLGHSVQLQLNGHYTKGYGYYEEYKADEDLPDYGLPLGTLPDTIVASDLVRRRWLDNDFYGATFALRWSPAVNPPALNGPPVFLVGGAASRYVGEHYGEVIWAEQYTGAQNDYRYYDNNADKRDANLYFKNEMRWRKGLSTFIDLQGRFVRYEFEGFDNQLNTVTQRAALGFFNPKAGFTWDFARQWSASAYFGIAHREPNRDDYTQSTPESQPRPERLDDWEVALRTERAVWQASANFYFMDYRDQLALNGQINDVGAYNRVNVPRSYRAGLELEALARIGSHWRLQGNAAFSRNRIREFNEFRDNWDTGEQERVVHRNTDLAFSPSVTGRGEAQFAFFPEKKAQQLSAALIGKYVGKQYLDNTSNEASILPAYFVTDLRLNYDLKNVVGRQLSFILSINNLLDARYSANGWVYRYISQGYDARPDDPYSRLEGNGVYQQAGFFPQAGRYWMLTARVEF